MVTLWSKQICLFLYLMFYFLLRRFVAATTMQLEWLWWLSLPFSVVAARLAGWGVSIQYSVVGIQSGGYSLYKAHSLAQVSPSSTALIATSLLFIEPQVTKYTTPHQIRHKLPNTRTPHQIRHKLPNTPHHTKHATSYQIHAHHTKYATSYQIHAHVSSFNPENFTLGLQPFQESRKWVHSYHFKKASAKTYMKYILCGEQCCNRVTPPLRQVIGLPLASDYCWLLLI